MQANQISVIVSTYERPTALQKVLSSLSHQTTLPGEIIVADDGSGPETRDMLAWAQKEFPVPLRHFRHEHDGFRKTIILNQCLVASRGTYLILLDGDCVPHLKFIADHAALAEAGHWVQGRRCFVRQRYYTDFSVEKTPIFQWMWEGRITGWAKGIRLPLPIIKRNTAYRGIIGCNMGLWREDVMAVNGFDEAYTAWGGEDSDLGARLYHLGRPRKFVYGRAIIYHLNHPPADRKHYQDAKRRLAQTIQSRKVRCERGLDQYLPENATPA